MTKSLKQLPHPPASTTELFHAPRKMCAHKSAPAILRLPCPGWEKAASCSPGRLTCSPRRPGKTRSDSKLGIDIGKTITARMRMAASGVVYSSLTSKFVA